MAQTDREALVALYIWTDGPNWNMSTDWDTDTPLKDWYGVTANDQGRVVALSLGSIGLQGHIPPELGALSELRELILSSNKLTGPIPEELGKLTALEILYLDRNNLSGPIPKELGKLTALETLYLNGNNLSGPIPPELGKLAALEKLYLFENKLSGTVPLGVWKLPHTGVVDISDNLLTQLTDPDEKTASTREVLNCLERVERMEQEKSASYQNYFVNTDGNPWEFPPAAVAIKGRESIRRYYDTWEQCDFSLVEIHALKVVLVGAYGAGKTSLARSLMKGRGDRTPEKDENRRTTVGVDLLNHRLRNGTDCKIYDVAGQISYYGLHQYFLTERAVYVIVWDATRFEGLSGKDLDQAIQDHILEWVCLLHMRTPVCTVMLVASHYDMLVRPTPKEKKQLLMVVEKRFLELHTTWKSERRSQNANMDERMTVLPGVFAVGCKLESASRATVDDGLQAVDEALSKQASVASRVPPSWVAARELLDEVRSAHGDSSSDRPWELRSVIQEAFKSSVMKRREEEHPESWLSRLQDVGIRDSMEGAIDTRAFSGTLISHDDLIVLDVVWLARVLKPILDHRRVIKNKEGRQTYANRVLTNAELLVWADELVDEGILRKGFARFLWNMEGIVNGENPHQKFLDPVEFEKILEEIGVTIPLPGHEGERDRSPAATEAKSPGDDVSAGPPRGGMDLLVIMRLPFEVDAETRKNLDSAREAALSSGSNGSGVGNCGLKALFNFEPAGAPHGLPERVMALSHKIGEFSSTARWRLGGLFLLREKDGRRSSSRMILEYDMTGKTFVIEALGRTALDFEAIGFVISALFHVASFFPGVGWTGWMECGLSHGGQKMYHLAPSDDKQNHKPGSWIIPRVRSSRSEECIKQRNRCGKQGQDAKGPCTVDPDLFGDVVKFKAGLYHSRVFPENPGYARGRTTVDSDPSGGGSTPFAAARDSTGVPTRSWCRMAFDYVFEPLSGKIFSSSLTLAVGFFIASTTIDDSKRVTLGVCFGFAGLCLLVAVVAAVFFVRLKIEEGKRDEEAKRADQRV